MAETKRKKLKTEDRKLLVQLKKELAIFSSAEIYDILDASCIAEYKDMTNKKIENFISRVHKKSIYQKEYTRKSGKSYTLWITKVDNDNRITATTREALLKKLIDFYGQEKELILKNLFPGFIKSKSEENVTAKTLKEYSRLWKTYYECDPIADRKVTEISVKEWKTFFAKLCTEHNLTKRKFKHVRIVIFGIMTYCVDEGLIPVNPLRDVNYRTLPYADDVAYNNVKAKPFTDTQAKQLVDWCINELKKTNIKPVYPLAIIFNLNAGLRYAEMAGLKWEQIDFENRVFSVTGQAVLDIQMNEDGTFKNNGRKRVDHCKAHETPRIIPMTDTSYNILKEIQKLGLSDEYVFPNGHFRYHTYNDKIKQAAKSIGLDPKNFHTHCLRSTVATNAYNSCFDIKQVQMLMGHTTPEMTSKYINDWRGIDALRKTLTLSNPEVKEYAAAEA